MKENLTHVVFVIDRSGSMYHVASEMEVGITSILKDQKDEPGQCTCSIWQFDNEFEEVIRNIPIQEVTEFKLVPRGGTALVDSVVKAIDLTGRDLSSLQESERPSKVIFVIITDGQDNLSREFTPEQLKERITNQTNKYSWTFMFLGANQDAISTSGYYGIHSSHSLTFTTSKKGTTRMSSGLSNKLKTMRYLDTEEYTLNAISGNSTGYTDAERKEQEDAK